MDGIADGADGDIDDSVAGERVVADGAYFPGPKLPQGHERQPVGAKLLGEVVLCERGKRPEVGVVCHKGISFLCVQE